MGNLKGRNLLSITDLTKDEIYEIFEVTKKFKVDRKIGETCRLLEGKNIALIFEFESTRTRVGFEAAINQLGGGAIYLPVSSLMLSRGEPWEDTGRVLSRIVDGIVIRAHEHETANKLAKHASVPVINAATNKDHPTQTIGELFTIWEKKKKLEGLKLVYCGMTRAICHSLLLACPMMGIDITVVYPEIYEVDKEVLDRAYKYAKESGSEITLTHNLLEAVDGADVIYSCILVRSKFVSEEYKGAAEEQKINIKAFQVTPEVIDRAKKDVIFMHPGPAYRGLEVTSEVLEGPHSVYWDQVENAFQVKKALLSLIL